MCVALYTQYFPNKNNVGIFLKSVLCMNEELKINMSPGKTELKIETLKI